MQYSAKMGHAMMEYSSTVYKLKHFRSISLHVYQIQGWF